MHGTLKNAIFTSLIGWEIDVIDTLRFNNDVNYLYRLATALGMRPYHEYWCKCTWQTKGMNKTASSDRLDHCWQLGFQWHRRGIEPVFESLDCFTMQLFHSAPIFCCYICICVPRLGVFGVVYWSLGCRVCFGISNVALVLLILYIRYIYIWKGLQLNSPKGVKGTKNAMHPTAFSKFAIHISPFRWCEMIYENAHCMYGIRTVLSSGVTKTSISRAPFDSQQMLV